MLVKTKVLERKIADNLTSFIYLYLGFSFNLVLYISLTSTLIQLCESNIVTKFNFVNTDGRLGHSDTHSLRIFIILSFIGVNTKEYLVYRNLKES